MNILHKKLDTAQKNADLTIDMKIEDMEIVQEHELTYAGPASVAGTQELLTGKS